MDWVKSIFEKDYCVVYNFVWYSTGSIHCHKVLLVQRNHLILFGWSFLEACFPYNFSFDAAPERSKNKQCQITSTKTSENSKSAVKTARRYLFNLE